MIYFRDLSIKKKIIVIQLITTSVVLLLLGGHQIFNEWIDYKTSALEQLNISAQLLAANSISALQFFDEDACITVLSTLEKQPDIVNAWIYNAQGDLFATYGKTGYSDYEYPKYNASTREFTEGYIVLVNNITDVDENLGTISLRLNTQRHWHKLIYNILILIIVLFVGSFIAFLLSSYLQKSISVPILNLAKKVEEISSTGNYVIKIPKKRNDEIGTLYSEFNNMLNQIHLRQQELDEANEQLQTVLDTVPGTISWLNSDLKYLGVNRRLADTFKLKVEDFIGQPLGFKKSSSDFIDFVDGFFKRDQNQIYKEINSVANDKEMTHLIIGHKDMHDHAAVFV
ncbi:MAG: HAMP domain-containing protein, partial [Calditrichia bacterium]|nr:HAMP domain-containing protein [Calditrichia bacterium]